MNMKQKLIIFNAVMKQHKEYAENVKSEYIRMIWILTRCHQ